MRPASPFITIDTERIKQPANGIPGIGDGFTIVCSQHKRDATTYEVIVSSLGIRHVLIPQVQ